MILFYCHCLGAYFIISYKRMAKQDVFAFADYINYSAVVNTNMNTNTNTFLISKRDILLVTSRVKTITLQIAPEHQIHHQY